MKERLQKYMADCGVASRRKCEEIISQGRVKVNDCVVTNMGFKVDTEIDKVKVDDSLINPVKDKIYIALNKPVGYVSTVKDEMGRKTVIDLIGLEERIYPIGRLDYNTSGLLLLTNDGEVYNKVIHPRKQIDKTYIALVKGIPTEEEIERFCNGIDIGGYITAEAKFIIVNIAGENAKVEIKIHEGKNRQIRKMCEQIEHPVMKLKRVSVGEINLNNLPEAQWRYLSFEEINYLKNL